jgi:Ca2+-dependent lipid-binding protein
LDVKNIEPGILGLGRTDPFVELQKKNVDPVVGIINWITAYRSEHVHDNLNPVFKSFELTVEDLCYADEDWPLRMVVYDWQKNGKHRVLGMAQTSLSDLLEKKSKGGNADRSSAMSVTIEGTETAIGLIVVLESNVRER